MMRINIYTYKVIIGIFVIGTLTSCTEAEIYYPIVEEISSGLVRIYPDQSGDVLPALEYYFYNTDTAQEYITRSCDGSGNFEGSLPVGIYRVIATNTNADNVTFTDMHSYEQATVSAVGYSTTRADDPGTHKLSVGQVYSTVIEELTVSEGDTVFHAPVPTLLTKQLTLVFSIDDVLNDGVVLLSGVLPGVYSTVHLYTCKEAQAEESPDVAVYFERVVDGDEHTVHLSVFGIYDPAYGENYRSYLRLDLTMSDGTITATLLDLTDIISEAIEKNGGAFPSELSIPIKVTRSNIGIGVEVGQWIEEGEDGQEITN